MSFETLPRVRLQHHGKPVDARIALASTFWSRFRGLIWSPRLSRTSGLLIEPCSSIHMLGMRYPIEAIFVAKEFQVLKICRNIRPWIDVCCCCQARAVLEWLPGSADDLGICVGDSLRWEIEHE